jgi:hypothetical protein
MQNPDTKQLITNASAIFLVKLESAHKIVVNANCPADAIKGMAIAEQLKLYAKQRDLSQEMEHKAHALYIDAMDRLGELDELCKGGRGKKSVPDGNGLKVSRKDRMKARRLHKLPAEEKERFRTGERPISELDHKSAADLAKPVHPFQERLTSKGRWLLSNQASKERPTDLPPAVRHQNVINEIKELIRSKKSVEEIKKTLKGVVAELNAINNILESQAATIRETVISERASA